MNTLDKAIKTLDASIIRSAYGYVLGVNNQGTIYLAFPGETSANPHMYLGKDNPENRKQAMEVFRSFEKIGRESKR